MQEHSERAARAFARSGIGACQANLYYGGRLAAQLPVFAGFTTEDRQAAQRMSAEIEFTDPKNLIPVDELPLGWYLQVLAGAWLPETVFHTAEYGGTGSWEVPNGVMCSVIVDEDGALTLSE